MVLCGLPALLHHDQLAGVGEALVCGARDLAAEHVVENDFDLRGLWQREADLRGLAGLVLQEGQVPLQTWGSERTAFS